MPLGAAASETHTVQVQPGDPGIRLDFSLVLCAPTCHPIGGGLTWGLSPNNGTATLSTSAEADNAGRAWFELDFNANACGTYTVTVRLTRDPRPTSNIKFIISGKPSCPTGSSSGTTSLPRVSQLVKVSDDNQVTTPGDSVILIVELRDSDGNPKSGADVNFSFFGAAPNTASLDPETATTDANGRAQTTFTLSADAEGEYIIRAYSSENSRVDLTFTVTVDTSLPKATRLEKISGSEQSGFTDEPLTNPFVVQVRDQHDDPLEDVTVTFAVTAGDGSLSATTAITDQDGQAQTTLTLGTEPGTNTIEATVEGISQTKVFNAEAILPPPTATRLSILSGDNQEGFTGEPLTNPFIVQVRDQYDDPLEGVTVTFAVTAGDGSLSATTATTDQTGQAETTPTLGTEPGTNTVQVSAEGIAQTVTFNALAELLQFDLSLSIGFNLIHLPLKVRAVDGMPATIQSVSELYNALGGAGTVNYLITHDSQTQTWYGYFGDADRGTTADRKLTGQTGILANMIAPVSLRLSGDALGTDGRSTITLNQDINLVGLPLKDSRVTRVSDLFTLNGIGGNVSVITHVNGGEFKVVGRAGALGDIEITGGQAFILNARRAAQVGISGIGWSNPTGTAAASPMAIVGIQAEEFTPVLALRGSIVDGGTGLKVEGFRVTVKNVSTGSTVAAMTPSDEIGYRSTIVDIETGRVARVGDILEISAQSPNPFIGVEPLRYTVTAEDVKQTLIQLPPLVAYEIPVETELLHNYPNPFNPETWIPYRLAEDAFVTLTIYDQTGQVVRTLDVGHRIASAYESRSKAIHWDGRNDVGERVASGVYFYTLTAGDFSTTRKMLIIK